MKKNNLVLASIIMLIFSVISKISGFLREMIFAYFYGASNVTDAYIASTTVSTSIFAGITVAVSAVYIPTISMVSSEKVSKTTSNIINTFISFIIFISFIGIFFSKQLITFVAFDFSNETLDIASNMTKIILPFSFLYVTYNILNGYMQVKNVFWTVGVGTVINNVVSMIFFAISKGNVEILAVGYVLSWVFPSIFLLIISKKKDFKYSFIIKPNDEVIKNIVKLGIPLFLGQLIFQLNTIIDKNFSSMLGEGVMTIMKYATQLISFVTSIFVLSIVSAIYPTLAKLANENNFKEYKKIANTSMNIILLVVIPVAIAFMILSTQIVEIVFMRGKFDEQTAKITAEALMAYSLGLPAISLNEILNKQFYSIKDTKTPVFSNIISLSVNILLNFILVRFLGHIGLAIATSIATTVLATVLYCKLSKKIGDFDTKRLIRNLLKILISAVVMAVSVVLTLQIVTEYTNDLGNLGNLIEIIASALIGAPIYFTTISVLKIDELSLVVEFLKNKIKKA